MTTYKDKTSRWGKMRPETMRILLDAICEGQTARKNVLAWLCGIIRTADNIPDRERKDVTKWLIANGYTIKNMSEVYTVQYTHEECAAATGCDVRESKRQRDWLIKSNVLITVQSGKKGYPGLFLLAPILVASNVTQSNRLKVADDATESNQEKVTYDSRFGDTRPEIGWHAQSNDLRKANASRIIHNNPNGINEKWICSNCGGHSFEVTESGWVVCPSCNLAHKPP